MRLSKFVFTLIFFAFVIAIMTTACLASSPEELKPGSERVLFLADSGTGSGGTPESALAPIVPHPDYDPNRKDGEHDEPNNHLNTGLYQATEMLKDTGGTIVICGPVVIGNDECTGYGTYTKDMFTAKYGENTIKYTSVYDGVDYRETNNASITLTEAAELTVLGRSIWENITFLTGSVDRLLSCGGYDTLIGEGVECRPVDELMTESPSYYLSISGGHRYSKAEEHEFNLTIKSGTFYRVIGSTYGVSSKMNVTNSKVNLILEGTTSVVGEIIGSTTAKITYSGEVNITINGGKYSCDIYGTSKSGFSDTSSTVNITVNGGIFNTEHGYDYCSVPDGFTNNPPSYAGLNLENAPDDTVSQFIFGLDADSFTNITYPKGKKATDFTLPETTKTEPSEDTEAAVTDPTVTDTDIQTTVEKNTYDKTVIQKQTSDFPARIIFAVAAAVVVITGIVCLVVYNNKKSNDKK